MKNKFIKYPRTVHLPWSLGTNDDKVLNDDLCFHNKRVIVTIKMDGENFSGYNNFTHARSIDSNNHPSRNYVKGLWYSKCYSLNDNIRVCCENLYAKHQIHYHYLKSYLYVISVWKNDLCLNWSETKKYAEELELPTVEVFYDDIYDKEEITKTYDKYKQNSIDKVEGYVIRLYSEFLYKNFQNSVAKFVEPEFRNAVNNRGNHWLKEKIISNKLWI